MPRRSAIWARSAGVMEPRCWLGVVETAWKRRSRRLLETTNTEENAIAAPAISGLSRPKAARGQCGDVVGERPEQVPLDGAQGAPRQPHRVDRGPEVAAD